MASYDVASNICQALRHGLRVVDKAEEEKQARGDGQGLADVTRRHHPPRHRHAFSTFVPLVKRHPMT